MMNDLIQFLSEQFQSNQFFQGGLIMGVAMALWAWVRGWPKIIWGWIVYHTTVELDIPDTDRAFRWVNEWLGEHRYSKRRARRLTVSTKDGREGKMIILSPAPGNHWIIHKRRLLILNRDRNTQTDQGNTGGRRLPFMETFNIQVIGRNRQPAIDLIAEAREFAQPDSDEIEIHQAGYDGYWNLLCKRKTRAPETVILEGGVERVLNDVQAFLDNRDWYIERGIPYRRGYLLKGSPGNGKSSLIVAVASHFRLDVGYLNLSNERFEDRDFMGALANVPAQMLVVIEDVDCVYKERETEAGVSFSGFINALDGIASPEGHILMMTTNHPDKLDPALIRPGRVDVEVEFRNATATQAAAMFRRFYPRADGDVEFGRALPADVSMAKLQGHLIVHKDDPQAAISSLSALGDLHEQKAPQGREE